MPRISIIDYGVGNLRSVEKAFQATGCDAAVTSDLSQIEASDKLVLPGVGAFRACMDGLRQAGFEGVVRERVARGVPLLGVCVGMQMLFEESEEFGHTPGLGLLRGAVRRFDDNLLAPQVGWNQVQKRRESLLLDGIEDNSFFYFVHSYYCDAGESQDIIGETEYGRAYSSIVGKANLFGVQFHPEKSQAAGLRLLNNFASLV